MKTDQSDAVARNAVPQRVELTADLGVDTVKQAEMFAAIREIYNIPRDENLKLRDVGQKLSEVRDAVAVIGAFDQLRSRDPAARPAAAIRHLLVLHKTHVEEELRAQKVNSSARHIRALPTARVRF